MKSNFVIGLLLCCVFFTANAQESTDDSFVLSEATLSPGGEEMEVVVSLNGSRIYTGYNMDITLPEGMEVSYTDGVIDVYIEHDLINVVKDKRGNITSISHNISASYGVAGDRVLRIACASLDNTNFTGTDGPLFTMYLKASSFIKPGIADIKLSGLNLTTADKVKYVPKNTVSNVVTISTSATAPLSVNSTAKWSTCVLPFATATPSGVTAYTVSNSDADYLYLTEAESIAAYTPYVLYAENGFSGNVSGTVDPAGYPESGVVSSVKGLNGAITLQEVSEGYVLQNGSEGVKFYPIASGDHFSLKPGKCWMSPDASGSKGMGFSVVDPSGVKNITAESADGALYTLDGKKVVTPVAGQIYVKNGKKVLKK